MDFLYVEKAKGQRGCYSCGRTIKKGEKCFVSGQIPYGNSQSICGSCCKKLIRLLQKHFARDQLDLLRVHGLIVRKMPAAR